MIYGSVCSGIEAATVAWHPLGWKAAFFSEIETFPRAVLAHHYPETPLHGDFTTIQAGQYAAIDLLVGGTPCQSFSVAGLRKGLDDPRGNLMLGFGALAKRLRPRWLVLENVPGVLSSNGGRDFGTFLGMLAELGYGFAYRVLDAQFFGVAQRRRRVFVVGYLGDWRRAAAVLFERHSLQGHPAPSRKAGQKTAPTISNRPTGGGGLGTDFDCDGGLIAGTMKSCKDSGGWSNSADHAAAGYMVPVVSPTLRAGGNKTGGDRPPGTDVDTCDSLICMSSGQANAEIQKNVSTTLTTLHEAPIVAHALRGEGFDASEDGTGRGTPLVPTYTLAIRGRGDSHDLEFRTDGTANAILTPNGGRAGIGVGAIAFSAKDHGGDATEDCSPTLRSTSKANRSRVEPGLPASTLAERSRMHVAAAMQVRRLTPRECERLQGFPDDYTLIPVRGKPAADGPRYKALGNSMAVPVMRWIGERIQMIEEICAERSAA